MHWEIGKIGSLFTERKTKVSDKVYPPLSVTKQGILPQLETAAKSDDSDNRKLVCAGDFVINSRSDRKGSCGLSDFTGSVSLINIVLTPRDTLHRRYVHYLLGCHPFSEEYYRHGKGIVDDLWTTRYSEMKSIYIPIPPQDEQDQIAYFLDWKISGIDWLIAIRKEELTNLEYLKKAVITREVTRGNWECIKLKRVARINPQCDSHGLKSEDIVTFAPMECIRTDRRIPKDAPLSSDNSSYTAFNDGDIAIAKVTPCFENDNICIMENLTNGYAFGSSELFNIRPFNIDTKFLLYYLMSHDFKSGGVANMTGAIGLKRVPSKYLRNALVPYPPISEQRQIADYLDRKCAQIDSTITNFVAQIDTLKELKARLISDTVTGKIDVRNIPVPEQEKIS